MVALATLLRSDLSFECLRREAISTSELSGFCHRYIHTVQWIYTHSAMDIYTQCNGRYIFRCHLKLDRKYVPA